MKIVLASNNKNKISELSEMLNAFHHEIIPQSQFNIVDAEETGLTFVENAIIKARHAAKLSGLPAIADDSGLSVYALNGAPGIYSARYGGKNLTAEEKNNKLLTDLSHVPGGERGASYHCALVFMLHADDPVPLICEGSWHGTILQEARGENGFGFDPIFYVNELAKSAAELSPEVKNKFSHRAQALQFLIQKLADKLHESSLS